MKAFLNKYVNVLILVVLMLIWGSSFILMKRSLLYFSSTELGALRIIFAGLALLPFFFKRRVGLSRRDWFWLALSGLIGQVIPAFLFAKAQTVIDSSLAGILNSTTPIFALIVGIFIFKMKAHWVNFVGIIMGFVGAVLIIWGKSKGSIEFNLQYSGLVLLATIMYAFNVNIVKHILRNIEARSIAILSVVFWLPFLLALLFFTTPILHTLQDPKAVMGLIYPMTLGMVGTALALVFFNILIKRSGVLFATSVTYLIPVVASIIGFFDGEMFKASHLLWIAIILLGVYLVNFKPKSGKL